MSYVKTTWTTGDKITAEKLNNLESGVEAAGAGDPRFFDCNISVSEDPQTYDYVYTLDGTFADLGAAALAGKAIIIHLTYDDPSLGDPARLVADSVGMTTDAEHELTFVTLYLTKGVVFGNKPYISQTAYAIAADGTIECTADSIELTKA